MTGSRQTTITAGNDLLLGLMIASMPRRRSLQCLPTRRRSLSRYLADVLVMPDGTLMVSDDRAGTFHRIAYNR